MRLTLLTFLIASLLSAWNARADDITLVADVWCPYNCVPGSDKPGVFIDVAQLALSKAGHKVIYKTMPWARAIEASRKGEFTGIVGAFKEDAPDFVFPEQAVIESGQEFFVKTDSSWKYKDLQSLDSISLGVIRDYAYGDLLDPYIKAHVSDSKHIQVAAGDDALGINLNKLFAGRIDSVIEDTSVMRYYLQLHKLADKVKSAGELSRNKIYIAFSPANPHSAEYAKIVGDEINQLQKDGKMREILKKYGLQ